MCLVRVLYIYVWIKNGTKIFESLQLGEFKVDKIGRNGGKFSRLFYVLDINCL